MPSRLFPSAPFVHRVHLLSSLSSSSSSYFPVRLAPPPSPSKHHPLRKAVIIPVVSASLALSVVPVLVLFFCWYRKLLSQRRNNKTSPEDGSSFKICRFKYRQLKRATKSFSESQKLGKGGFGVVYRGLLPNGKEVAVKRLDLSSRQGEREFQNELSICRELDSPYVVRLLGYCTHGKRVRLLVYECMQNRSLQEALFDKRDGARLDWSKRFKVIVDVAKALEFLHLRCNPPIIHGDIKPSNILLDGNFSARIADFGLARFKTEDLGSDSVSRLRAEMSSGCRFGTTDHINPGTPEMSRSPTTRKPVTEYTYVTSAESPSVNIKLLANEVSSSSAGDLGGTIAVPTSLSMPSVHDETTAGLWEADSSQKLQSAVAVDGLKHVQADDSLKSSTRQKFPEKGPEYDEGRRQETSGELGGKKNVMDWLGSEHCGDNGQLPEDGVVSSIEKGLEANEQILKPRLVELSSETLRKERREANRKSREWWKDEYFAELSSKNRASQKVRRKRTKIRSIDNWKDLWSGELSSLSGELRRIDHLVVKGAGHNQLSKESLRTTRSGDLSWCRGKDRQSTANDTWSGDSNGPFSSDSMIHRQWSGDLSRSGELVSREVSSTTSTRGTVCYVAPEYCGNGVPSEKSDIYSFGVLMLVILSGRRPIQVTASPFREFESANLISWARCLSQSGKLLDLMDAGLRGEYNHKQASMCITVALLCLQRVPTTRPDISQVVKILSGENMAPPLPFELSPSPPSRTHYRLPFRSSKNLLSIAVTP